MPLCNMMTMQHRKNKRGLQQLSDAQKLEAITKVQKGETKAAVAREFGVPESTLRGWCKKAKLNGHCHSVMNKSLQVTSTMSPVLLTSEMAYRDCSYSKGSGSDEGSTTHPFSDEQEDDDTEREAKPPVVAIPEEQRRVLDWLNYGHYPQLPTTQQTPPQIIDTTKPAQPVVTSSTCDDVRNVAKVAKVSSKKDKALSIKGSNSITSASGGGGGICGGVVGGNTNLTNNHIIHNNNNSITSNNNNNNNNNTSNNNNNIIINHHHHHHQNGVNGFGFYNWCKSNTSCGGYSSPVSPVSSDKNDSYDDEPLALIVPSKRRISDLESALKNQLSKMYQEQQQQQTDSKQILSVEEALQHGEVFLDWLRACSDPNVTVLQAMQIGTLIKNIRSSLERNQNRR